MCLMSSRAFRVPGAEEAGGRMQGDIIEERGPKSCQDLLRLGTHLEGFGRVTGTDSKAFCPIVRPESLLVIRLHIIFPWEELEEVPQVPSSA